MPQIKKVLPGMNPWWEGEFRPEFHDREVYDEVRRFLHLPQIIAFTGLRRVGKTTLLQKFAADAMAGSVDPRDVLYFTFDEFREVEVREVLGAYEDLLERRFAERPSILLLDEVQKLEGWADQVKALYDRLGRRARIVISGSESLFLRKGGRESLAGRMFEFPVHPLTFREYLAFRGIPSEPAGLRERELARALENLIRTMGLPELVSTDNMEVVRKYVRESVVEKVLYRDLPGLLRIRDLPLLESLLHLLLDEPGQILDATALAGELNASRRTVATYLHYLEQSFLVRKLYNFSRGRRKVERKLRRYYPTLLSAELAFARDDLSRSKAFEWFVVNQLRAEFFWRDPYQKEVDIVLPGKEPRPIEVKFGRVDYGGVRAFMRQFKVRKGWIVSRGIEETRRFDEGVVEVVPAHEFLLKPPPNPIPTRSRA